MYKKYFLVLICLVILSSLLLATRPISSLYYHTTAYAASGIVKTSYTQLLAIHGYNSGPAQFLQLFNSTTVPNDTTVPYLIIAIPANDNFFIDLAGRGITFPDGLSWSNSSTATTKTIGSADVWLQVEYN